MTKATQSELPGTGPIEVGYACVLGVRISDLALPALLSRVEGLLTGTGKSVIAYVNVHALNLAYELPWFRQFLNESTITFCDGFGVRLAANILGERLANRHTPPDFMHSICRLAAKRSARVFFLGAEPGVAEQAALAMREAEPKLQIQSHHGYFDKTAGSEETTVVINRVNDFGADLLCVGFGMPIQEKWISENRESISASLVMPVGAMLDFLSGRSSRAPRWMTDHGFEWLGRLVTEPSRLWRRYLIGIPIFYWRVAMHHVFKRSLPAV